MTYVFDSEVLPNYTLISFKDIDTGEYTRFRRSEPRAPERLKLFMTQPGATFVGFNSKSFDAPVVYAFCAGCTEAEIKRIANDIISSRMQPWDAMRKYSLPQFKFDHIDLIEVAPSFVGLKAYGARMHMPVLQDMPLAHDAEVTEEQKTEIDTYCDNDLDTTQALLMSLEKEVLLRVQMSRQYGADMRSKSDSQMAEQAYISSMGLQRRENQVPRNVTYTPPSFLNFNTPALQALLQRVSAHTFEMKQSTGHVVLPDFLGAEQVVFGSGSYQLGVGGIHSTHDRSVCYVAGTDSVICDIDAESFYPSLILLAGMYPEAVGPKFLEEYRKIYDRRIEAKRSGDKATNETLKISLNGTFGKLASRWSVLYAPEFMLAVTLTGQFTLLMLIEHLEASGVLTLSANTDGIAVRYARELETEVKKVVSSFEQLTGLRFEFTPYRVLAMKDVNNYIAVKPDRRLKEKGIYAPLSLKKNPTARVCAASVGQWLANGTPFLETIRRAPFCDFLSARNVTGGGQQGEAYLGKVVRWYQSNSATLGPIVYASNGNKVPKTEGARACMVLQCKSTHPADLDYGWYHKEAVKIAVAVGCSAFLTAEELQLVARPPKSPKKPKNGTR